MDLGPKLNVKAVDGQGNFHPMFHFSLNIPGPIGDYIDWSHSGYPWNKTHVQIGVDLSKDSAVWMLGPIQGQIFKKHYDWRKS